MSVDAANDSSFSDDRTPDPAAQAQAALLLMESLLHTLLDNGTLTKEQVMSTITGAAEVKADSASEHKEPAITLIRSLGLLENMRHSIAAHGERQEN